MIELGQPIYKISSEKKTIRIAVVVGKFGKAYENMLLVRFEKGGSECVFHLNEVGDGEDENPGWWFIK